MDIEDLVDDLRKVRRLGIPRTAAKDVPALSAVLALHWPDLSEASRRHKLEDVLAQAADELDDESAEGIRIGLGIGPEARDPVTRELRNKKSRREAFAVHHSRASETVRRRGGLEDQEFTKLAKAILSLLPTAANTPSINRQVARPQDASDDPQRVIRNLASEAETRGQWGQAAQFGFALTALVQQRAETNPGDHESQLAEDYLQTGLNYMMAGELEQAREHCINSLRISQTLSGMAPTALASRERLALAFSVLGMLGLISGDERAAEQNLTGSITILEELADDNNQILLASTLGMLGMHYFLVDQELAAERALSRVVRLLNPVTNSSFDAGAGNILHLNLAHALQMLGALHWRQAGRAKEAEEELTESISLLEALAGRSYEGIERHFVPKGARILLAGSQHTLGMLYIDLDQLDASEQAFSRAVELIDTLMPDGMPATPDIFLKGMPRLLAVTLIMLGGMHAEAERTDEAVSELTRAVSLLDSLPSPVATSVDTTESALANLKAEFIFERNMLAFALMILGVVHTNAERWEDAECALVRSRRIYEELMQDDPTDSDVKGSFADLLDVFVEFYQEQGKDELAGEALRLAQSLREST